MLVNFIRKNFIKGLFLSLTFIVSFCVDSKADISLYRIAGEDRYETASKVNDRYKYNYNSEYAIIVNGVDFRSSLYGSYMASSLRAPLYVINMNQGITQDKAEQLSDIGIKKLYVIGDFPMREFDGNLPFEIKFFSGNSSNGWSDTLELINDEIFNILNFSNKAIDLEEITNSTILIDDSKFPDLLSSIPYTSSLLRTNMMKLGNYKKFYKNSDKNFGVIVGGINSVPKDFKSRAETISLSALNNRGIQDHQYDGRIVFGRISGEDRYKTAVEIANSQKLLMSNRIESAIIVNGTEYPDALASGSVAYFENGVILLTNPQKLDANTKMFLINNGIKKIFIVGGENSVSKKVENELKNLDNTNYVVSNLEEKIILGAKKIDQYEANAPMGCEASSLLMGLHLKGYALNKNIDVFLREMPIAKDNNPNHGFASTPFKYVKGVYQSILPKPMAKWGQNYGNVQDISGASLGKLKQEIRLGNPVVFFGTAEFKSPKYHDYFWGKNAVDNAHVMLMDGYSKGQIHVVDPAFGGKDGYWVDEKKFEQIYGIKKYAVVIR
ncbi:hypothetical protein FYJ71_09210 [Peptostreptococcus anaerobius]|uniref:Peptidase C39-like domain-containing protein n=1 Tax=Peptostreptococcus porci TaxID=2652282 RepID=A0A6N7XFF8_9FIRM|nr:cell wall-binding repeat-containing protein [Peptostreptococcus porci]MST63112.1 hypothetical protein [Peptostreptococcus porci]